MTANTQLTLLQQGLTPGHVSVSISGSGGITLQNQMVDALNKIVWNTYMTSVNTNLIPHQTPSKGAPDAGIGVYASGGWITGGIPGLDSVPMVAMPDEFVVNREATRALTQQFGAGVMDTINTGRLPEAPISASTTNVVPFRGGGGSGNAELVAEVKALRKELEQMRKENNSGNAVIANTTARGAAGVAEHIGGKIEDHGKNFTREIAFRQRSQR